MKAPLYAKTRQADGVATLKQQSILLSMLLDTVYKAAASSTPELGDVAPMSWSSLQPLAQLERLCITIFVYPTTYICPSIRLS